MNSEREEMEGERKLIFAKLAVLGDRTMTPAQVRPQIDNVVSHLRDRLRSESSISFDITVVALKRCGVELPHKAPAFALVTGLLTTGDLVFAAPLAKSVIAETTKYFTSALREGRLSEACRALRYLACLTDTGVVAPASLASYIRTLLDTALREISANLASTERRVHVRGRYFAEIALSVLPWAGPALKRHAPSELAAIATCANEIFEAWVPNQWRFLAHSSSAMSEDCFVVLMKAVQGLEKLSWVVPESVSPDFHAEYADDLTEPKLITLPELTIAAHSKKTKYAPPKHRLRLYGEVKDEPMEEAAQEGGDMDTGDAAAEKTSAEKEPAEKADVNEAKEDMDEKEMETNGSKGETEDQVANGSSENKEAEDAVVHFVKASYVSDILDNFYISHKMCAERLLCVPMLQEGKSLVVEGLFSDMCVLPTSPFPPVYYGVLFVDLCKMKDSRISKLLLPALETIFQLTDEMDQETFDRLTTWFAFHLSNFAYRWNWADWIVYADPDMEEKFPFRALFCRDVLKRCISLSYYHQVSEIIPEEMKYFLPTKPTDGNKARFDEEANKELLSIVTGSGKQPPAAVRDRLNAMYPPSENEDPAQRDAEDREANLKRLAALLRSILQAGYKTLSHFDTVGLRYIDLLHEMTSAGGTAARQLIVLEVTVFWESSHMRRLYSLDKLSMNGVIDGLSVLDFVLALDHEQEDGEKAEKSNEVLIKDLANSDTWELVRLVLERATAREEGARMELTTASKLAAKATEGDMQAVEVRLHRAKEGTTRSMAVIKECLALVIKRLFEMCDKLLSSGNDGMADRMEEELDDDDALPGFNGAPLWMWRCLGIIREFGRKHPRYVGDLLTELKEYTAGFCEKHAVLQKSMSVLEELAKSDISPQVH